MDIEDFIEELMEIGDEYRTPMEWRTFLGLEREPTFRTFGYDVNRVSITINQFIKEYKLAFRK